MCLFLPALNGLSIKSCVHLFMILVLHETILVCAMLRGVSPPPLFLLLLPFSPRIENKDYLWVYFPSPPSYALLFLSVYARILYFSSFSSLGIHNDGQFNFFFSFSFFLPRFGLACGGKGGGGDRGFCFFKRQTKKLFRLEYLRIYGYMEIWIRNPFLFP